MRKHVWHAIQGEKLNKKREELKEKVFPMLNLMLSVRDEPLKADDEKDITETIVAAFFKTSELIIYHDYPDIDIDYTIDGRTVSSLSLKSKFAATPIAY